MTPEAIASVISRLPATWLHYSGHRHILIKKKDNLYIVQEAEFAGIKDEKPILKLTGRLFEIGDGLAKTDSVVLSGVISAFASPSNTTEIAIAKVLGAWGCWSDKLVEAHDATQGGFSMAT